MKGRIDMTQDQIQLPEPDGYVWSDEFEGGCFAYAHDVRPTSATSVFNATTVRRLIAEAVAAERERATEEANRRANASWSLMAKKMVEAEREDCIAALDALEGWSYDDPASSAIAAIRSRGDQT